MFGAGGAAKMAGSAECQLHLPRPRHGRGRHAQRGAVDDEEESGKKGGEDVGADFAGGEEEDAVEKDRNVPAGEEGLPETA